MHITPSTLTRSVIPLILSALNLCLWHSGAWAQVGLQELRHFDMPITLVYPTSEKSILQKRGLFEIEVAVNAPLDTKARHLIVMSHGTGGSPLADHTLAATLARAGFVVAQPLHRGDNHLNTAQAGPESWKTRPAEISETIDFVVRETPWAQQLDLQHVGVHGMSAGGVSALVMAGGQWRMLDLIQHCAKHMDEDAGFCLNGLANQPLERAARRGKIMAAAITPSWFLPSYLKERHGGLSPKVSNADSRDELRPDTRVSAISALVPVAAIFTPESLQAIQIPVGLTVAGQDKLLIPQFHSGKVLQYCTSCTTLSSSPEATHFDWLSPWPAALATQAAARELQGGLPNPKFSDAHRQSAFDRIAEFFQRTLVK